MEKPKKLLFPKNLYKDYYGRIFSKPGIVKIPGILSSYYGPNAMTKILNTLPDFEYIICPLYDGGDFQIGVTGGFDKDETWVEATNRELKEEIGLYPDPGQRFAIGSFKKEEYNGKIWYVTDIETKKTKFLTKEENNIEIRISGKSPYKIACLVHGPKMMMERYASKDNIYRYKSEDNIVGVVFLQVKEAKELVRNYY
jgi:ADP-ribose pyrophosphatase YjhB (NUDIX family)